MVSPRRQGRTPSSSLPAPRRVGWSSPADEPLIGSGGVGCSGRGQASTRCAGRHTVQARKRPKGNKVSITSVGTACQPRRSGTKLTCASAWPPAGASAQATAVAPCS